MGALINNDLFSARMKQIYNDLSMLNREILREHTIRCQNHQDLVDSLKQINVIIQRASNLRSEY